MNKIEKIKILTGVYWVEIKEANLRILCASPADTVKHLIKIGLNKWQEVNGVTYESGPNAILLSDTSIQNGQLSNLCEFPILQMFYRQGLIIPKHPNNDGSKPLLIGSQEQLISQMNYIYRGNYGLISKEEILACGIDEASADEIMRMKLKFAFGKMVNPKDLLDTIQLAETAPTHLKKGVHITRKGVNVFRISYEGEYIEVDLNISSTQKYEAPYELQYMDIKKEYFSIIHSGQGDGWNTKQPAMSSVLVYQGKIYLIDAGANIEYALEALGIGISEVEGIFHTHSHDDHFAGLTNQIKSDKKIKYYSTRLVRESVMKKFSSLLNIEEEQFYDYFDVIDLEFDVWNHIDGLEIKPIFSPHPVETNILLFRTIWEYGYKSYAHYADLTSFDVLKGMITEDKNGIGISQEFYNKVKKEYLIPADIKKVDVGGGMIHGASKDFRDDTSNTIILAHMSQSLTTTDKEIGSTASFGSVDVLIPAHQEYDRKKAYEFLSSYHDNLPRHILDIFVNLEINTFNPGTIIQKKGDRVKNIYVLLTGIAESIGERGIQNAISAGAIVGKIAALMGRRAKETVRTVSYVKALKIPVTMFLKIVHEYNLYPNIEQKVDKIQFLRENNLFTNYISYPILDKITKNMELLHYPMGSSFTLKSDGMFYMVVEGELHMRLNDTIIKVLKNGDFFGEEESIFDIVSPFTIVATSDISLYAIDGNILQDIPIVRWKLFEEYKKKEKIILEFDDKFRWDENLQIGVQVMDIQFEKIIAHISTLLAVSNISDEDKRYRATIEVVLKLIDYIRFHFDSEENLLQMYHYEKLNEHISSHDRLINTLEEFLLLIKHEKKDTKLIIQTIYDLLFRHINEEDRDYSAFLNSKGVF